MKPPPLLLGAALLFWGWQAGFPVLGAVLALALEGAQRLRARWEFTDDDFRRLWTFCSVLLLVALVYAFTENEGPSAFTGLFQNPNPSTQGAAGASSARTAAALLQWLPMILFPFVAAHALSTRVTIPLTAVSWILRRRRLAAQRAGRALPQEWRFHPGFPYFGVCLLAAGVHPATNANYFWGVTGLLAWALWSQRSRRFAPPVWAGALAAAVALAYAGQLGLWRVQRSLVNLNVQWLVRLRPGRSTDPAQTRTALGRVGQLKLSQRVVIRLQPLGPYPPPALLREAAYRIYRSQTWDAGGARDDFLSVPETPLDSGIWPLLTEKSNTAAVRIASYLQARGEGTRAGLLPLPEGAGRLERLRAFTLDRNSLGSVLATGPGLVVFDALYGPGPTIEAPADSREDLDVPVRERAALSQVSASLNLTGQNADQAMQTLGQFFQQHFTYRTWQKAARPEGTNDTPLSRFLLEDRAGHCEYFATAATLLLRHCGIPARYVVGYAVHEAAGRGYVVRESDAHAWCRVWDADARAWRDFDPTPSVWVSVESPPASLGRLMADGWWRLRFELAKIWWGQGRLRQYLLWGLTPVLVILLYQILFRRRRAQRRPTGDAGRGAARLPGWDSEFYALEAALSARGEARAPHEPVAAWLERVTAGPSLASRREPLRALLRLHYRYRFDPRGLAPEDRAALRHQAQACLEGLTNRKP